jgi:hypothetical protein
MEGQMDTIFTRKVLSVLIILVLSVIATAQTPQYYNFNTGTSLNSFPFNVTGGKAVNSLFLAGEFSQPAPLPAGNRITAVYFRTGTAGTRAFTNLHILMAQSNIITLTTGAFYPGPYDTVFAKDTSLTSTAGGWMKVTLKNKFNYDPSRSLIMFVGQCGYTGTGTTVYNTTGLSGIRRTWSVGGCPFAPYAGGDASLVNFGVDVEPAASMLPDLLYYKFENNFTIITTPNCAVPGVGTNPASVVDVDLTPGGQFDTCITGTGIASAGVYSNWWCNLGTSSWTISMWISIPSSTSGSAYYLFGDPDAGTFRCFHNGVAGPDSLVLRGTGITDVRINGIGPAPTHVAFVYDSATATIKAFKNGVLNRTVVQAAPLNLPLGSGFRVGGYSTSTSFIGKMDEFRLYRKALANGDISFSYNTDVACGLIVGLSNPNTIPAKYELLQNYPNPFNPVTKISYALPKNGLITLKIYDMLGREVAELVNEVKTAGNYTVDFNASSLSSGTYFYRLESNGFTDTKKMIIIK